MITQKCLDKISPLCTDIRLASFDVNDIEERSIIIDATGNMTVTARDYASSFSVVSPHSKGHSLNLTWIDLLGRENHTVVVLMGLSRIVEIVTEAYKQNIAKSLPCAIISNASRPNQKVAHCTLETLEEASKEMIRPSILVFGEVVQSLQR